MSCCWWRRFLDTRTLDNFLTHVSTIFDTLLQHYNHTKAWAQKFNKSRWEHGAEKSFNTSSRILIQRVKKGIWWKERKCVSESGRESIESETCYRPYPFICKGREREKVSISAFSSSSVQEFEKSKLFLRRLKDFRNVPGWRWRDATNVRRSSLKEQMWQWQWRLNLRGRMKKASSRSNNNVPESHHPLSSLLEYLHWNIYL